MNRNLLSPLLVIVSVLVLVGCSTTSQVEVSKDVNFSNYKTFAWINDNGVKKSGRVDNDIVDNNIKNSVGMELEKKGWMETDQQPDVWIDYNVMVEKGVRRETEPAYNYPFTGYYFNSWRGRRGYFYNPTFFSGYHSYDVPFKEGTLTVNMIDAKSNKLVWQGWAKGDITNRTVTSKEAVTDVKSIFRKLVMPEK